jgi:hypothetical protein
MSGVLRNIDPPPPHRPVSVYPPPPFCEGEDTLAGWKGGWGLIEFGRRKTLLCTLCKYFVLWHITANFSFLLINYTKAIAGSFFANSHKRMVLCVCQYFADTVLYSHLGPFGTCTLENLESL